MIEFYWELGKMIAEKQTQWGAKLVEQVAKDLKIEFPDMQGLSRRNLFNAKKFYEFYGDTIVQQPVAPFGQQPIAQIPWGHNILIFSKSRDLKEAIFYIQYTLEHHLAVMYWLCK